jgi:hypothetical protein
MAPSVRASKADLVVFPGALAAVALASKTVNTIDWIFMLVSLSEETGL